MEGRRRKNVHMPSLRVAIAYNLRTEDTEEQAERLHQDYVDNVQDALESLGHTVVQVEVTGEPKDIFNRLQEAEADLVFNLAEGEEGVWREAFYPMLYEFMGLPYTCAGPGILGMGLDKRLTEEVLAERGVEVPRGRLVTPDDPEVPPELRYPLLIKPNFEGSAMGIHQDSVVEGEDEAQKHIDKMLEEYPEGLDVEEFIEGRELTIGYLAEAPQTLTEIVEYRVKDVDHNILDYETKMAEGDPDTMETICPAELNDDEKDAVEEIALRAFSAMRVPDTARVDLRMREDGKVFLIEINPLPGLKEVSPLVVGAKQTGLTFQDIIGYIVLGACRRYHLLEDTSEQLARQEVPL